MFDWDPQKARANQLKHGVPFEEAATAFLDPEGLDGDEVMKRSRGLSAQGGRAGKKGKDTRAKKIDFSDIPELSQKPLLAFDIHARNGEIPLPPLFPYPAVPQNRIESKSKRLGHPSHPFPIRPTRDEIPSPPPPSILPKSRPSRRTAPAPSFFV